MRGWVCACCGRWRVSVELVAGRHLYRLARCYRPEFGGMDVLGEVSSVPALERLLRVRAAPGLADFRELPPPG